MKLHPAILVLFATLVAWPVQADDKPMLRKTVSEAAAKAASDTAYTALVRLALANGWSYAPEQIENGYRRHFEEFKLLLMDQGYTIVVEETGRKAHLEK